MAITKQDIFNAANAIQASGTKPTMALVREKLGGGSLSTISPALREWSETIGNKTPPTVIDIPSEVKNVLDKMGAEVWRSLSAITNEKLVRIETEATAAILEATKDRDVAIIEISQLEEQIEKLLSCKAQLEQKNKSLELQIEKQQATMDAQATQITDLKLMCSNATTAEKIALEKAAALAGKMDFVLEENKRLQEPKKAPVKKAVATE